MFAICQTSLFKVARVSVSTFQWLFQLNDPVIPKSGAGPKVLLPMSQMTDK